MSERATPIRVLLVHGQSEWYGADRAAFLLARELGGQGFDVTVALPGLGVLWDKLVDSGIAVVHLDPASFRMMSFGRWRTIRYLAFDLPLSAVRCARRARGFDVVHVNTSIMLGALLGGRLARRPTVLHVRESYEGRERAWRAYARVVRRCAARVIATSEGIAAEARGVGLDICVIPDGLDFDELTALEGTGPIVCVGRLNAWKGHDVLIDAIASLRARGIDVPVEIAGDTFPGDESRRDTLVAHADERDVSDLVRFLGYVDDVPRLLRGARLYVQPSRRPEPFGLALLEAMAAGLACIATRGGGPSDIIRDGDTGVLVPRGDVDALANAIATLWDNPSRRTEIGRRAADDVRRRFSISASAQRVADLYRSLVATTGTAI